MRTALFLLLATSAHADPDVGSIHRLKSGAILHVEARSEDGPGLTLYAPRTHEDGQVDRVHCSIPDEGTWRRWAGFFEGVAEWRLPSTHAPHVASGCFAAAAYGTTPGTRRTVILEIRTDERAPVETPISRNESTTVARSMRALVGSLVRPTPRAAVVTVDHGTETALLRTLYAVKGWDPIGHDGWEVDLEALQEARGLGLDPSLVVAKAIQDQEVKAGGLAQLMR